MTSGVYTRLGHISEMSKTKELSETEKRIFEGIEKNDVLTLKTLLIDKQNINIVDENLMTPLQYAAYKGNKEMVQLLLDQVQTFMKITHNF